MHLRANQLNYSEKCIAIVTTVNSLTTLYYITLTREGEEEKSGGLQDIYLSSWPVPELLRAKETKKGIHNVRLFKNYVQIYK